MDRWPAAAFKADCVLEEELDRLWHLVSILKAMTWSHSSGRRVGLVLWDVMMEKGDRKLAWHFWDGVTREESSTQKGRKKKKKSYFTWKETWRIQEFKMQPRWYFLHFFAGDKACCSTKITFDKRAVVLQGIASSDAYLVMNTNTRHRICHAAQMQ